MKNALLILSVLSMCIAQTSNAAVVSMTDNTLITYANNNTPAPTNYATVKNSYSASNGSVFVSSNDEISQAINIIISQAKQNEKHTLADNLGEIKKKAEQGNSKYQVKLGMIYYEGKNIRQDFVLARKMFQKAANQGDIQGQNMLGFFYENGLGGLSKNKATAKEWYGKICDTGNEYGCTQYRRLNGGQTIKWVELPDLSYNNSAFKALR